MSLYILTISNRVKFFNLNEDCTVCFYEVKEEWTRSTLFCWFLCKIFRNSYICIAVLCCIRKIGRPPSVWIQNKSSVNFEKLKCLGLFCTKIWHGSSSYNHQVMSSFLLWPWTHINFKFKIIDGNKYKKEEWNISTLFEVQMSTRRVHIFSLVYSWDTGLSHIHKGITTYLMSSYMLYMDPRIHSQILSVRKRYYQKSTSDKTLSPYLSKFWL